MATIQRTTADTAGFVPQHWANRALDVLRANLVLAKTMARDTDFTESGWQGKSITVGYPGTFTAQDKVEGTVVTPQTATGSSKTLTLDHHKIVGVSIEDFAQAAANGNLFERYLEPATISIAEQFEADLWASAATLGTGTPLGTVGTPIDSSALRSVLSSLNTAKAPMNDRHIILGPADQAALLGDSLIQNYFAFSQPGVVTEGEFGRAYGFAVHMSQMAPNGYRMSLGAASAGTFTLTVSAQTTSAIPFGATAATVQAALQLAVTAGLGGGASVSGAAGKFNLVLTGASAGAAITGGGSGLTGGAFTISAAGNTNIAYHRNALMYACRPFEAIPQAAGVASATANDPESGLSIRVSSQYDINAVGTRLNVDILYGVTALRQNQAVILNS